MKLSDFIFKFKHDRYTSICRVRTFVTKSCDHYTVLTGISEHSLSGSVTNSIELIVAQLCDQGYIPGSTKVIEHYEHTFWGDQTFDLVTFSESGSPSWSTKTRKFIEVILECDGSEFSKKACEIERLYLQIQRASHEINPFAGVKTVYNKQLVARRFELEMAKLPRSQLLELVSEGASERELQNFLKRDLTYFAEMYASPQDDYICFSEFPVGDGIVDFVVMTGRSRMDVILIEIKGANFPVQTKSEYKNFTAKFNECVQQARRRSGYIYRNIENFRKYVHDIRIDVEQGESRFNSLIGPSGFLSVSSEKDINIQTVSIAGFGANGPEESRRRHDFEMSCNPPMKIESWNSWSAKLKCETEQSNEAVT